VLNLFSRFFPLPLGLPHGFPHNLSVQTLVALARTAAVGIFLFFYILLAGPPLLLHCVVTGSVGLLYRGCVWGAATALRLAGVRVRVEGLENIPSGVCLFIANHVSNVDPPIVVCALPRQVALMAKEAVFRIPIFGTALRLGKFIPVNRTNRAAAIASVERARGYLKAGMSYVVFAEGTRSPDGRLMKFRKGTFVLAIETGAPVVPVSVAGTQRVMPRGALLIRSGEVRVSFHPPVDPSGYTLPHRDQLMERVRSIVASGLPEDQLPLPNLPS
jgi:1-acyl-sn-glycerol-3-phosphate acyltransferase